MLLGSEAAALALVSAIIVVQVTSWQTIRKSIERVLGVLIGVSLAVLVAHFLGLSIWTTTLMIFFAQLVGLSLQKRGQYLATQIPISAALALVLGVGAGDYPLLRLLGTLIGGLVGISISLLLSPPIYVFRTRDAVVTLTTELAGTMPTLAAALTAHLSEAESRKIYETLRDLEQRVHTTEQAYSLGLESTRLNPWAQQARHILIDYPDILLALDRLARQMRRIAYTINEPGLSWAKLVQKQAWATDYAGFLEEIGQILVQVVPSLDSPTPTQPSNLPTNRDTLNAQVEHTQQQLRNWQAQLVQDAKQSTLPTEPEHSSLIPGSRLATRGAILTDLRRMLEEVREIVDMATSNSLLGEQIEETPS